MRMRDMTMLAGVLAALAFAQTPAEAQTLDLSGIGGGNAAASVGDPSGGTAATATTSGGSLFGGSGSTVATVTLGGGGTASGTGPATATVTLGSLEASDPSGSVVIGTGSNPVSPGGTTATIVLGTDGTTLGLDPDGSGPTAPAPLTQQQFASIIDQLDDSDVQALKLKCADVMDNPSGFDEGIVGVCQLLATL